MERYNPKFTEEKWQKFWSKKKSFAASINNKSKKFATRKTFVLIYIIKKHYFEYFL